MDCSDVRSISGVLFLTFITRGKIMEYDLENMTDDQLIELMQAGFSLLSLPAKDEVREVLGDWIDESGE